MPKCCHCKQPATQRFGLRVACGYEHAVQYGIASAKKKAATAQRKARALERAEVLEAREKAKTLKRLCAEAREVLQKYARLRDRGFGACICCGNSKIEHGAHFWPVGSKYMNARLSLNPDQIHGSCLRCNVFVGGGNITGYIDGIRQRYGEDYLAMLYEIKRRADSGEDAPLTKDEVRAIKKSYAAKCRELEKERV